jgi:hypothetical protein
MLETPEDPAVLTPIRPGNGLGGAVTICPVRSISRKDWTFIQNPQRPYAEHQARLVKRWSDLHGDMQSQAEMPWPLPESGSGNKSVGPYPSQP